MSRAEGTSEGPDPKGATVLQRGAGGRWALVDGHGAIIEADASEFVEIEQ